MNKRNLINLFMLGAVGLLLAFIWLEPGKQAPQVNRLTDADPASVTQIRITRGNNRPIVLARENDEWRMQTPYTTFANPQRVQELLAMLMLPVQNRFLAADRDLQQYGLASPGLGIDYGNNVELVFGDTEPLGKQRYVLFNGYIHLVTDTAYQQLSTTDTYLVETRPLVHSPPITGLQLPKLHLQQDDKGAWLDNGVPAEEADEVNRFIDNWRHARALFVSGPLDAMPEDAQYVTVSFSDNTQRRFILQQAKTGMTLIDTQSGLRYLFTPDSVTQLLTFPAAAGPAE